MEQKTEETQQNSDNPSESQRKKFTELNSVFGYLLILTIGIFLVLIILVYQFLNDYLNYAIAFFTYFEKAPQIIQFFNNLINTPSWQSLTAVMVILVSYIYLLNSIQKKGVMINDINEKETKTFNSIISVFGLFNFAILIPLILYLIFVNNQYFEAFVIIALYMVSKLVFLPLFGNCVKIVNNYSLLTSLEPSSIKNRYDNLKKFDVSDFFNSDKREKFLDCLRDVVIWYWFGNNSYFLKCLIVFAPLALFFSLIWNYNLLSILYVQMILIFWFFIISSISLLPKGTVNIRFLNGTAIKNVFIVEDSEKGYLLVLNSKNEYKKLMKSSIKLLESSTYS